MFSAFGQLRRVFFEILDTKKLGVVFVLSLDPPTLQKTYEVFEHFFESI